MNVSHFFYTGDLTMKFIQAGFLAVVFILALDFATAKKVNYSSYYLKIKLKIKLIHHIEYLFFCMH